MQEAVTRPLRGLRGRGPVVENPHVSARAASHLQEAVTRPLRNLRENIPAKVQPDRPVGVPGFGKLPQIGVGEHTNPNNVCISTYIYIYRLELVSMLIRT